MALILGFLSLFFILKLITPNSYCQCASELCEKTSLSLNTNTKRNHSLEGYVFETLNFSIWEECFNMCLRKCQCLSFNFNEVKATENCELNDANKKLTPEALKEKDGITYYELVRSYYGRNGVPLQSCSKCHNKCCDSAPCQHGGTCHEVCDVDKRRFNCTCPPGYTGHKCQFPPLRSCKEVKLFDKGKDNGIYHIVDQQNVSFPVYCDFDSEVGAAWTLIQSHSFQNNSDFKSKPFFFYDMPINHDAPEWNTYRVLKSRMKSIRDVSTHWRATCNFPTDGVDYRDYWRVSLESLDLLVDSGKTSGFCLLSEFVNVHGNECTNCTVLCGYSTQYSWL